MRLIVDASVLVAEAMRARGRELLARSALDLITADVTWSEAVHELERRVSRLVARGRLEATIAPTFLGVTVQNVRDNLTIVPARIYTDQIETALRRIPRDPRDAPTVALALTLDCGIWTSDRDFFGCGLPVWTTDVLLSELAADVAAGTPTT